MQTTVAAKSANTHDHLESFHNDIIRSAPDAANNRNRWWLGGGLEASKPFGIYLLDCQPLVVPPTFDPVFSSGNIKILSPQGQKWFYKSQMSTKSQRPRAVQLATSVLEIVSNFENYLEENGQPPCSFEPGAASAQLQLPPSLQSSVDAALDALEELTALLLGPMGWMTCQLARLVRETLRIPFTTPKPRLLFG